MTSHSNVDPQEIAKFEELGSCQKVLRFCKHSEILLPRHQTSGFHKGELLWKDPD